MKHPLVLTLLLVTLAPAFAQDAKPIATVNGREIPAIYGDMAKQTLLSQGAPNDANLDARAREALINQELLSRAAIDKGLDKNPRLVAAMEMLRREQLTKAYLEDYVKNHPVTDAEIKAEYDKAKAAAGGNEYKARHVLVKTEAEAKAIIAQLDKKVAFDKLAREKSLDKGSAKNGGDLGWNVPGTFVKAFGEAMQKLKKGETTKVPVQTQFGWHVIRLDDMRPTQFPALDTVKNEVRQQVEQKRVRDAITELRAKAKIE
ncbi:peptidylprolyl isomerase [Betaproteobacteria bacterium SCN2]|jgi:peptidyl-prolyl cis-trans isomerase C|nr:peptidylprolyl isomerase [Betaproteobacteria bacterium SCN2]